MTIDERIERLTERHEALTQSIELMHHDIAERDARYNDRFSRVLDIVETLADTAKNHERHN